MENINFLGVSGVAFIVIICWMVGLVIKATNLNSKWIPVVCGICGAILGVLAFRFGADGFPATDYFQAVAIGIVSGLGSVGCHQIYKQLTGGASDNSVNTTTSLMAELEALRAKKISLEALLEAQQGEHDMHSDAVDDFVKEE